MENENRLSKTILDVLSKVLGKQIIDADYQTKKLHGGTLGDVKLVSGIAKTADEAELPYRIVQKRQKKWMRPGDPDSWRREYDLAVSDFGSVFSDMLYWPVCYSAALNNDETEIWMEYIHGVSGGNLTIKMLEQAAEELGRFQGRLHQESEKLPALFCLSDTGFVEREHEQWHKQTFDYEFLCSQQCRIPQHVQQMIRNNPWNNGKTIEYNYLRSDECDIPGHLKQMLIDIDDNRKAVFEKIKQLPVVFCHRDFWVENIFFSDGTITLIDWDGAGFGYLGEDIASLIIDETKTDCLHEYYRRLIPAYHRGISQYLDFPMLNSSYIWEMIVLKFGYRIVQEYMFSDSFDVKQETVDRLQKVYEMRELQVENC